MKKYKIEVSKVCDATAMNGAKVSITEPMLKDMAASYDPTVHESPFVLGHPKTEDKAFGWAEKMEYDEKSQKLFAVGNPDDIDPGFKKMVENGDYKKVSLSMFPPTATNNPKPGHWYPKHQGALGAATAAVPGLKPMDFKPVYSFSEDPEVLEFSYDLEAEEKQTELSKFEKFQAWMLDTFALKEIEGKPSKIPSEQLPTFSENDGEVTMTEAEIKALQADNEKQAATLKAQASTISKFQSEATAKRATSVKEFCENLVENKKLMPATASKLGDVLNSLNTAEPQEFSFSEGGDKKPSITDALMEVITESAEYSFDFAEKGQDNTSDPVLSFATPVGVSVDPTQVKQLAQANIIAKEQGIDLVDALIQVENAS